MRIHCWLKFKRHRWEWKDGKNRLMRYRWCVDCGWPGGHDVIQP